MSFPGERTEWRGNVLVSMHMSAHVVGDGKLRRKTTNKSN